MRIPIGELKIIGGLFTANEIQSQPSLWLETFKLLSNQRNSISEFLNLVYSQKNINVILTGAGTSAFVGNVLEAIFNKHTGIISRAIPTTDLVTHPEWYIYRKQPTLLISFARSGNSPESVKSIKLANDLCGVNIYHLVITCNPDGKLIKMLSNSNSYIFLLPPGTNDKSLAMTSSFTSMLLTGLFIARINELKDFEKQLQLLIEYGENFLLKYVDELEKISGMNFTRAVFLGSGPFKGIAQESHLKLLELTDGKIVCKHDSFLGFRHGPKAMVDENTLVVYLFSNNKYVQQYEKDLVESVNKDRIGLHRIGVMENCIGELELDTKIIFSENGQKLDEEFLSVVSVLPAQVLGFFKSINLGLKPDSPSVNGIITRVVQGVKLYNYNDYDKEFKIN